MDGCSHPEEHPQVEATLHYCTCPASSRDTMNNANDQLSYQVLSIPLCAKTLTIYFSSFASSASYVFLIPTGHSDDSLNQQKLFSEGEVMLISECEAQKTSFLKNLIFRRDLTTETL